MFGVPVHFKMFSVHVHFKMFGVHMHFQMLETSLIVEQRQLPSGSSPGKLGWVTVRQIQRYKYSVTNIEKYSVTNTDKYSVTNIDKYNVTSAQKVNKIQSLI